MASGALSVARGEGERKLDARAVDRVWRQD